MFDISFNHFYDIFIISQTADQSTSLMHLKDKINVSYIPLNEEQISSQINMKLLRSTQGRSILKS